MIVGLGYTDNNGCLEGCFVIEAVNRRAQERAGRRRYAAHYRERLRTSQGRAFAELWPNADWDALEEECGRLVAGAARALRDAAPHDGLQEFAPVARSRWLKRLAPLREAAGRVLSGTLSENAVRHVLKQAQERLLVRDDLWSKAQAYARFGHEVPLGGFFIETGGGPVDGWRVGRKPDRVLCVAEGVEEAVQALGAWLQRPARADEGVGRLQVYCFSDAPSEWHIGFRDRRAAGGYQALASFASAREARGHLSANRKELESEWSRRLAGLQAERRSGVVLSA